MERKVDLSNTVTTQAIKEAHQALYDIMCKYFNDTDFDLDMFISNIVYWYEFQQLAKSYGKKLIYFTPKKKEGDK